MSRGKSTRGRWLLAACLRLNGVASGPNLWQSANMRRTLQSVLFLVLLLASLPLATRPVFAAETPMSAEEFDAYTLGKTLTYGVGGDPYGVEEYLPGKQVRWSFVGDECRNGSWYDVASAEGPQICFVYEDRPDDPQCWYFFATGTGLLARFASDPASTLAEVNQSQTSMPCPGPDLGV